MKPWSRTRWLLLASAFIIPFSIAWFASGMLVMLRDKTPEVVKDTDPAAITRQRELQKEADAVSLRYGLIFGAVGFGSMLGQIIWAEAIISGRTNGLESLKMR